MANKAQAFAQLAENTARQITGSLAEWTGFLTTVGRLYRYNYHEQLMIYAQRPDATACAEYDLWNNKMNRYVRRGSKGIALIDSTGDTPKLRYVFDVSDTGGRENSRHPYLWEMQEHNKQPILDMLEDKFGMEENNLSDAFYNIAQDLAIEYYDNHKGDIPYLIENSFLEDYDEDNIKATFENAATVSIAYTLMKRCGLNPDEFFDHEDFLSIFDFNTQDAVALLGTAVSEQSEQVFRQIAITIVKTERERRNEYERNNLREERGLSNTRPDIETSRTASRKIRENEKEISSGTSDTLIQFPTVERKTISPSIGDRQNSQQEINTDNGGLTESSASTRQDEKSDGMGRLHEQLESTGRGNHTDGAYIQLTLFPTEEEQIQRIAGSEKLSAFSMPEEDIDSILRTGGNSTNSIFRIVSFYQKDKSIEEKAAFLQAEYKEGGKGLYIDGEKISLWFNKEGIHIAKGDIALYARSKQVIEWTDVAERIEELLNEGQFVTQDTLEHVESFERQQLAETLWYLHQNFADKAKGQFFDEEIFNGGFPSSTNHIAKLLSDPQEVENLINGLQQLTNAYEEDRELLRFHFYKPQKLLSDFMDTRMSKREFTAEIRDIIDFKMFITQDEVDKALTGGSSFQDGKYRIYEYFSHSHSQKEKEEFLKNEYGTGGRTHALSGADESYEDHSAKGIEYKRRDKDDNLFLRWNAVAKRIDYLIANNRYMTAEEKAKFEERQGEKAGITETPTIPTLRAEDTDFTSINQTQTEIIEGDEEISLVEQEIGNVEDVEEASETKGHQKQEEQEKQQKQAENNLIPYNKGDTVYFENGTPFIIEQIAKHNITLRDPSLFYPILRAESRESFLRLLELYPQPDNPQELEKAENYRITNEHLGQGSKREKFVENIVAITTLQTIEKENRPATKEEQEILSKYVGWGGLSEAFDKDNSSWSSEFIQLRGLLSEEEYEMARASTLNAHYTSPTVIKAIYEAVERMGFAKGNILEPSCGIGHFFGMLPDSMENSNLYGVELDSITGRIAKQLYPNANISITGFEKTQLPDNFFDLCFGNVPFGNYKLSEKRYDNYNFLIHDHFFAKALDKVRPGGVVAFITSKGTMDKQNPEVRRYLAQRAELLGAIRLPNNAFKNAGTEVTSDILFLQKRDRPIDIDRDWIHLDTNEDGIAINSYFTDNPEMILGTMEMKNGQFGMESTCTPLPDVDLSEQLRIAVENIEGSIPEMDLIDMEVNADTSIPADPAVKNYSFTLVDGEVYYRENSRMYKVPLSDTAAERTKGLIKLRDCTRALISMQMFDSSNDEIKAQQKELSTLYDSYTKKYGLINSRANKRVFEQDSGYYLLCSLEVLDEDGNLERKADMFSKRTIKQAQAVLSVDTASEALAVSISEKACVDLEYMAQLMGGPDKIPQIIKDLEGVIFLNPKPDSRLVSEQTPKWEAADEYLSGNVREKLYFAQRAAKQDPKYSINVQALQKVQPKELEASEIDVRLGATWVELKYYKQFMTELFNTPKYLLVKDIDLQYSPVSGVWNIKGKLCDSKDNVLVNVTYGTKRLNAYKILEDSLNLKEVKVFDIQTDDDGKEHRILNGKETAIAQQKQELIRQAFRDWIWKDPKRREVLVKKYNEIFNSTRPREYDGNHIRFVGINPEITLRPHQLNAVAHILYGQNTLLAHCVGAGKTYEMTAAAMESKRLGLCQKSLFVVPNHLTEQWGSDFLQLYPGANILVATKKDFTPQNRKKFCARIATGDYDAIIIGHSQFEKIPVSKERQIQMIEEQINEIATEIEMAIDEKGENFTVKQMEKTKKGLMARLEKLNDINQDDVVTFEELGVDRLFVDEADSFKNLFLYTKMRNVAGIGHSEAQKSSDMFMKCRYMDEITGSRGVVFATGTPISNSMTELYTMMRYLQYDTLQNLGLGYFDSWASSFGETVTATELAPEGTGFRQKTRFAKFYNLPELMNIWREAADIQTADMLKLPVPEVEYVDMVTKPSEHQKEAVKGLAERADKVRSNQVEPHEDNMLKITSDGKKLALDQRLMNPLLPDEPNSKINTCVKNVFDIWQNTAEQKSTQLLFCDLSTPHYDGNFNVYDDIKDKLIQKGVPSEEVVFIHDAKTEIQKSELFAKVRKGQVRVLIGSTSKMGAGTNVQDRIVALHHLDCPWKPRDLG